MSLASAGQLPAQCAIARFFWPKVGCKSSSRIVSFLVVGVLAGHSTNLTNVNCGICVEVDGVEASQHFLLVPPLHDQSGNTLELTFMVLC